MTLYRTVYQHSDPHPTLMMAALSARRPTIKLTDEGEPEAASFPGPVGAAIGVA